MIVVVVYVIALDTIYLLFPAGRIIDYNWKLTESF